MAITSENNRALNQDEHNEDAHAKRVILRGQDPTSGDWVNISAVDNGSGTYALNVSGQTDNTASGTISTQNLNPSSGTATPNSTVEISLGEGQNTLAIQTVGTYTGALTLQGSVDGSNWISFGGTPLLNANTGLWLATITSALQSVFFAKCSGFTKMRISANAAVTGSVTVSIGASTGDSFQGALGVLTTVTTVSTLTNITNWGNIVDNAAFTDGTTRLSVNGYIFDEVAGTALTENDAAAARIDSKRAQVLTLEDATTRGQRATVSSTGALKVDAWTDAEFDTTTNTSVAGSATSVQLLAANAARKEATITNDSTAVLYIKEGTTASTTDYKFRLEQYDVYRTNNYTGRIDGIWASATGNARISES